MKKRAAEQPPPDAILMMTEIVGARIEGTILIIHAKSNEYSRETAINRDCARALLEIFRNFLSRCAAKSGHSADVLPLKKG